MSANATGAPSPSARSHLARQQVLYPFLPTVADTLRSLAGMLVLALFILTFIVQPFRIPSESMEHTLLVGDFLFVNKQIYAPPGVFRWLLPYRNPIRKDVVVFRFPLNPSEYVVKRIIAGPGDRIHLSHSTVYLNGAPLREPYATYEPAYADPYRDNFPAGTYTDPSVDTHWWSALQSDVHDGNLTVAAQDYFVMGDNRNHSRDSRYWGFVPRGEILGRPFLIYFSLREPSRTDPPALPSDKLASEPVSGALDFARWNRMFHLVR